MKFPDEKPELYDQALKAYADWCNENGFIYQQPAPHLCEIDSRYVHLRNVNGSLADYDYRNQVILEPLD